MTAYGEAPDSHLEVQLDTAEIERFRDTVMMPAVDELWGSDFLATAAEGEEVSRGIKVTTTRGFLRTILTAVCSVKPGLQSDSETRVCSARITIERSRPDLTESMITAMLVNSESDEYTQHVEASSNRGELQAWQIDHYDFSTDPEDVLDVDATFEVQDRDGDELWGSNWLTREDYSNMPKLTNEEEEKLALLDGQVDSQLSRTQAGEIIRSLLLLGVSIKQIGPEFRSLASE